MSIQVDVLYGIPKKDCPSVMSFKKWITAAVGDRQTQAGFVIKIVDENEMIHLNHSYRHKNKATNVLSFPSQLPEPFKGDHLGDIAICAAVVEKEALDQKKESESHWAHMVVHGVLHLLGYDHEIEEDAIKMEALETEILHSLGFSDPFFGQIEHE